MLYYSDFRDEHNYRDFEFEYISNFSNFDAAHRYGRLNGMSYNQESPNALGDVQAIGY